MTKSSTPTKAELHEMLAEAVRNTQPQPVNTQAEPVRDVQTNPERRPRKARPAPKRAVKIKGDRASASRKRKPR
jgi:hypothetical protein